MESPINSIRREEAAGGASKLPPVTVNPLNCTSPTQHSVLLINSMVWVPEVSPEARSTDPFVPDGTLTGVLTVPSITTLYQLSPVELRVALIPVPWKLALIVVALQADFGPAGSLLSKRPIYKTLELGGVVGVGVAVRMVGVGVNVGVTVTLWVGVGVIRRVGVGVGPLRVGVAVTLAVGVAVAARVTVGVTCIV